VPEGVEVGHPGLLAVERQVGPVDHVAAGEAGHRRDAGVDQGHADALAGESLAVGVVRADDLGDVVQRALVGDGVVAQGGVDVGLGDADAGPGEQGAEGRHGDAADHASTDAVRPRSVLVSS
jgi:hypothetical protein